MSRGVGPSFRRVFVYSVVLIPGLLFPLGAALEAIGATTPVETAAGVTSIVAIMSAVFLEESILQDLIAYSLFALGVFVFGFSVLRGVGGEPTDLGMLLVSVVTVHGGVLGVFLARTGRLDGFARAVQSGPRT